MRYHTITTDIEIDLNILDFAELLEYVKDKGYFIYSSKSIIEYQKMEHFNEVKSNYTLEEIEKLLPLK